MADPIQIATLTILSGSRNVTLPVISGRPAFIVGGNGSGKSALVHALVSQLQGRNVIYILGSRSNSFDQESLSMTPASRRQLAVNFLSWDRSLDSRWRNISGTARNEKAIHDLQIADVQYTMDAANDIKINGVASERISKLQSRNSPIDRVNRIMEQANLPTRVHVRNGELQAIRGGVSYSIAKMSDGERAALILSAEVVSAMQASVFVLDEPELHLHRGITLPLISVLIKERQDCGFIVSTHELELPAEWVKSDVIVVRNCTWVGDQPQSWDFDVIAASTPIPEELRLDVLESRKQIVFVEGKASSLDKPLYSLLLPSATIKCRDSSRRVRQAVQGLRANQDAHHTIAYGIIDNDGLSIEVITAFLTEHVVALPVFSVEALYYSPEALEAVAEQKRPLGVDPEALLARAKDWALHSLDGGDHLLHLAARVSEQRLRNVILSHIPDREAMVAAAQLDITVSVTSPFPSELAHIRNLSANHDIKAIVQRYPVRESGILVALAKGLGFENRADYERAVLARVAADPNLKAALRNKLGTV